MGKSDHDDDYEKASEKSDDSGIFTYESKLSPQYVKFA